MNAFPPSLPRVDAEGVTLDEDKIIESYQAFVMGAHTVLQAAVDSVGFVGSIGNYSALIGQAMGYNDVASRAFEVLGIQCRPDPLL